MNGDGLNTISDLWPFLSAVYNWPGNQVVDLSMQTGMGPDTYWAFIQQKS